MVSRIKIGLLIRGGGSAIIEYNETWSGKTDDDWVPEALAEVLAGIENSLAGTNLTRVITLKFAVVEVYDPAARGIADCTLWFRLREHGSAVVNSDGTPAQIEALMLRTVALKLRELLAKISPYLLAEAQNPFETDEDI